MRVCILVSVFRMLVSSGLAQTPGFDPSDVVRQVQTTHSSAGPMDYSSTGFDDGEFLIDTSATPVPAPGWQWEPAVAFDGANYLVVWQDHRSGSDHDICGARVTPQGTVLDPSGIVVSQATSDQNSPALAFDGANFLVVWQDCRSDSSGDIYGARVTPAGVVLDPAGFAISAAVGGQQSSATAFDGANFLVAWTDYRGGRYSDIYGARVTPQGTVLDSAGIVISQASSDQGFPAVGFDGTDLLVVWEDNRSAYDIYGARVTPAGTVLDPSGIVISQATNYQRSPAAGFDGSNYLVVWEDVRSGSYSDIYGARVTPQGTVLDPAGIVVSQAAGHQFSPAVGSDGADLLVVWRDHRSGSPHPIYGARVTPAGTVLDTAGIVISPPPDNGGSAAIASDGASCLVVWQDHRSGSDYDIYGGRVTPQGTVLDPSGFVIAHATNDQTSPALAFDGTYFLVAWQDYRSGSLPDIYGARVTPAGTVLDPSGIVISRAPSNQFTPAVGFDGADFLVVWEDNRAGDNIYGARVTRAGAVLDTAGILISHAVHYVRTPALGTDGADFLVVWTDGRSGTDADIYGARVTSAGVVLDPAGIAISTAPGHQAYPAIAFDSANFLVVWQDKRSGTYYDIYGARVTPGGVVTDSGPVVRQQGDQSYPRLCRVNGSQMFLVYQGWAGIVGGKAYNTDRIWGKMNPSPGIEESPKPQTASPKPVATIIRGVLFLPEASSRKPQAASLLDISGRKVMDLVPGANDVRALAPGVYFVRPASGVKREASRVTKVVVTR